MKIAKLFGIEIILNWTTLLLVGLVGHGFFSAFTIKSPTTSSLTVGVISLCVGIGILLSILIHELSHAIVGKKHGIDFNKIILHLLGGAAMMNSNIPNAKAEFRMAIAGPVASIVLSILLFTIFLPIAIFNPVKLNLVSSAIGTLCMTNFILGIFNMIPAFPLDGGRILRSIIWSRTKNLLKATTISAHISSVLAYIGIGSSLAMSLGIYVPFFGVGLGSGIWLAMISVLIIFAAKAELKMVEAASKKI